MLSSQISKSPFLVIYTEISIYQSKFSNDFFFVIYTKIQNFFTFIIYTYFVDVTGLPGALPQNRAPGAAYSSDSSTRPWDWAVVQEERKRKSIFNCII